MRKTIGIVLSAALAFSLGTVSASAAVNTTPAVSVTGTSGDMAKMYRIKHELKVDVSGKNGTLDGNKLDVDKPILRAGRVYVPIRTLKQSGAADAVQWDAKKREVRVVMKSTLIPYLAEVRYRIGSNKMHWTDGSEISDEAIPVPFISGGRAYVPIRPLKYQGVAVSLRNNVVYLNWSEKIIDINQKKWTTDQEQATFTMLYQKDMYIPQFMYHIGNGGKYSRTGTVTKKDKDISLDGRLYNRMSFTVDLRPGINPLELTAVSAGSQNFEIVRTVTDPASFPVTLTDYATGNTKVTTQGYGKLKPGESFKVSGEILKSNESFDQVSLKVYKYDPSKYDFMQTDSLKVPILDNAYSGSLKFDQPGSYWVQLVSPKYYQQFGNTNMSVPWAEFTVEVK
jgi:hypothetical protein